MTFGRGLTAAAAAAGAIALASAPMATAAVGYRLTTVPPIGTVYANNLVTLGVTVGPVPTGTDATTPVQLTVTEPDGDSRTVTVPLTLGVATVATRIHEAGRYVAAFTFAPPGGERAEASLQFDAVPSPFSLS